MKTKYQKRCGRKPVDELRGCSSMNDALKASLKKKGNSMPTPKQAIEAEFRRSKHFQGKAVQG